MIDETRVTPITRKLQQRVQALEAENAKLARALHYQIEATAAWRALATSWAKVVEVIDALGEQEGKP